MPAARGPGGDVVVSAGEVSKGIFWQLEMHDVHIQLQRQSITVVNTYLGHSVK